MWIYSWQLIEKNSFWSSWLPFLNVSFVFCDSSLCFSFCAQSHLVSPCPTQLLPREKRKLEYLDAVKERYKHLTDVKRIVRLVFFHVYLWKQILWSVHPLIYLCLMHLNLVPFLVNNNLYFVFRHRHLPKPVYKAAALRRTMIEAEKKKDERRRAHSAPGSMPVQPFRKRRIIKEEEWFSKETRVAFSPKLHAAKCKIAPCKNRNLKYFRVQGRRSTTVPSDDHTEIFKFYPPLNCAVENASDLYFWSPNMTTINLVYESIGLWAKNISVSLIL